MTEEFDLIFKNHHAILVESERSFVFEVKDFFSGTNDVFVLEKDDIKMEDAILIKENANLRPSFGEFKILILGMLRIGREAEQALLKILEEPPKETKIILITPNSKFFSPTILSRVVKIKNKKEKAGQEVFEFLKKNPIDRLKWVEIFLKDENSDAMNLLSEIEKIIKEKGLLENKEWRESLEDIYKSKKALQIQGTSSKQIVEYIALVLPKF